jgi:hypothetical protein
MALKSQPRQVEAERLVMERCRVRSQKIYSLRLNHDIDKRTLLDQVMKYDAQGNLREQIYYDSTDLEMLKWTQEYVDNRLIGQILCIYRDTIARISIFYDKKGFPKEEIMETGEGQAICKFKYTCNNSGQIISSLQDVFPAMSSFVKQAYKYDERGFLILRYIGEQKPGRNFRYAYQYDKKGHLGKIVQEGMDTIATGWISYDYTRDGFLKSFGVKHPNGKHYKCYRTYDRHGHLAEELKNLSLNTLLVDQERNEFICDSKGLKKKRLRYKINKQLDMLYNYEYEYYE